MKLDIDIASHSSTISQPVTEALPRRDQAVDMGKGVVAKDTL